MHSKSKAHLKKALAIVFAALFLSTGIYNQLNVREFLLLSSLLSDSAKHLLGQVFTYSPSPKESFLKNIPPSQISWHQNRRLLSEVPISSSKDKELLLFLEKRWLAKANGFFTQEVDWLCPIFGFAIQVHPETTSSYARDPASKPSLTYNSRVMAWKKELFHPPHFPLILTRPFDVSGYLPNYHAIQAIDALEGAQIDDKVLFDVTALFKNANSQKAWLEIWQNFQKAVLDFKIDPNQILFIERVKENDLGGLRILPFDNQPDVKIEENKNFLLNWISTFGLTATQVELDRIPIAPSLIFQTQVSPTSVDRKNFLDSLHSLENRSLGHPQKDLMFQGVLRALLGFFDTLSEEEWQSKIISLAHSKLIDLCFSKVQEELELLFHEDPKIPFFNTVCHLEQIHSHLTTLLEIFKPFKPSDFPSIYKDSLGFLPDPLMSLSTFAVHSSGMTSLAGILKVGEKAFGQPLRVLYGENTYFEAIDALAETSIALKSAQATAKDWEEADLLLAQFNPVLKRGSGCTVQLYTIEKVEEALHKAFGSSRKKPLILALDCTLDTIHSPNVAHLLEEFQSKILQGDLAVICYRSGLKFDLLGMDNFAGAPFYMIHSQSPHWTFLDSLTKDPALQADLLSLNWFCLAYQYLAPLLDQYREQIFENTRVLLKRIPPSLLSSHRYQVIPFEEGLNPGFIDIKIRGPLHKIRASALVGGSLYLRCMEAKHPIFYRRSIGFFHPNFGILFDDTYSTLRLTIGLDPSQIDVLTKCFEEIDALNL